MERSKNITIIFLLAVGLLNSVAPPVCLANRSSGTKPASVLLQEGLYAEEVEGDLDAAIKIYQQVIAAAKETQRAAAQATYRIGMCYLKKGEKGKAAGQFRDLILKFPENELLIKEAQKQLAKLEPSVALVFGPVLERILQDDGKPGSWIDFDTGQTYCPPKEIHGGSTEMAFRWVRQHGIDGGAENALPGFNTIDLDAVCLDRAEWESLDPSALVALLERKESLIKPVKQGSYDIVKLIPDGKQIKPCFGFKTREDGLGMLQIVEFLDNPWRMKIRYKMLRERAKTVAGGWRKVFLPDADSKGLDVVLDLASGELLPAGEGKQQLIGTFAELGKGDLAYDRVIICLRGAVAKLRKKDELTKLTKVGQMEDLTAYQLPSAPCRLLVTTTEGDKYDVTVLSVTGSGLYLEYKILSEQEEVASVASFGPAKVVGLYDIDHPTTTEKECAIDFDTGKLSKIPPQARQMPGDDLMKWLSGSGIDAVAEIAGKNGGLIGIDVAVKTMSPYVWDKLSPTELRLLMVNNNSARQETTLMLLEDEYQQVFAFRTRDSGLGILQILDVDKSKQMIQFRYKMLQKESALSLIHISEPTRPY